jgi:hypothetical protein
VSAKIARIARDERGSAAAATPCYGFGSNVTSITVIEYGAADSSIMPPPLPVVFGSPKPPGCPP